MIRRSARALAFVFAALVNAGAPASSISAQNVFPTNLAPSNGRIETPLTGFTTVREMRDGRVLVPNETGGVMIADFATGKAMAVRGIDTGGRPSTLYALAGDSTLVRWKNGWILLDGLKPLPLIPATNRVVAEAQGMTGVDSLGDVLGSVGARPSDSATVIRVRRGSGAVDTITKTSIRENLGFPFADVREHAVLAPDGWIAVLRSAPFRVDWRDTGGQWIRGAALPDGFQPMTDDEKIALLGRDARKMGTPVASPSAYGYWPQYIEPISGLGLITATPDRKLLIARKPWSDTPGNVYDVVNRKGELVMQVEIDASDRIVGFGATSVYLLRLDTKGLYHLERYPWGSG